MADIPLPGRDSVDAQREMFRLAAKECGLTIPIIAQRSPLHESTMKGWRDGAAMPAWALFQLGAAGVPDHLLSLVGASFGKHVGTDETDDGDLNALGREGAHFLAEKQDAEADGNVTPIERAKRNLERAQENLGGMFARAAA